jgi:hypothetical protein
MVPEALRGNGVSGCRTIPRSSVALKTVLRELLLLSDRA